MKYTYNIDLDKKMPFYDDLIVKMECQRSPLQPSRQGVGITSLICQFLNGTKPDIYHGLGRDTLFKIKTVDLSCDKKVKLRVYEMDKHFFWQTPWPEQVTADIVIIAFDITNQSSLDWAIERFKQYREKTPNKTVVLTATKCDLEPAMSSEYLTQLSNELGVLIQFTSAHTKQGIEELFTYAARQRIAIIDNKKQNCLQNWHATSKYQKERSQFESI